MNKGPVLQAVTWNDGAVRPQESNATVLEERGAVVLCVFVRTLRLLVLYSRGTPDCAEHARWSLQNFPQ